jgi:hypothetical protein
MSTTAIRVSDFEPRESGSLRGFFTGHLPSGLTLHELSLHTREGKWWIAFPARPLLQDGVAVRDPNGKVKYSAPLVSFADRAARDRFTAQVLAALRHALPEVFAQEFAA